MTMHLQRINFRPNMDSLTEREREYVQRHFDYTSTEALVHSEGIAWNAIETVEVVRAARASGLAGWLTRRVIGDDRYHVGIYYGRREAVLSNVSLAVAKYALQVIAYHASSPVRYEGLPDLAPLEA